MFGFGSSANVEFSFKGSDERPRKKVTLEGGSTEELCIFQGHDTIAGEVVISPTSKKLEHIGVKIELIGHIELFYDRGSHYEFTSLVRELDPPGQLTTSTRYPFEFANVDKQHESYNGLNVRLRYFLRVTISRNYAMNIVKEQDFLVQNLAVRGLRACACDCAPPAPSSGVRPRLHAPSITPHTYPHTYPTRRRSRRSTTASRWR